MNQSDRATTGTLACAMALWMQGCATNGAQDHEHEFSVTEDAMRSYLAGKPDAVHRLYANVPRQGKRNLVLNHLRSGLAAMEIGEYELAEQSFDTSLEIIEQIYAGNPQAEKARSKFVKENIKDFRGEPYERAMAFYYRGLLYLKDGDYENARASFRGGMIQDSLAENEEYAQDFAVLAFLDGWSSQCLGDDDGAMQGYREARDHRGSLPEASREDNLLLIAETGQGPVKYSGGEHDEKLLFRESDQTRAESAAFRTADNEVAANLAEDIYWQATTRGGREVDSILEGKAMFKDEMETTSDVLVTGGLATSFTGASMGSDSLAMAGGFMALAGLVAQAAASATTPEADTRYWDNLPAKVHLASIHMEDIPDRVSIRFFDDSNAVVDAGAVPVWEGGSCAVAWTRSRSALDIPDRAPGSASPKTRQAGASFPDDDV